MKKVVILFILCFAAAAYAEVMTFPAPRIGDVSFDHTFHRGKLKGCSLCHGEMPGKIHKEWTQQLGHDFCVDCHSKMDKGPLRCAGCHNKSSLKPVTPAPAAIQKPNTSARTTPAPSAIQKPVSSAKKN